MRRKVTNQEGSGLEASQDLWKGVPAYNPSTSLKKLHMGGQNNSLLQSIRMKRNSMQESHSVDDASRHSGSRSNLQSPLKKNKPLGGQDKPSPHKSGNTLNPVQLPTLKRKTVMKRVFSQLDESSFVQPRHYRSNSQSDLKNPRRVESDWRFKGIVDKTTEFTKLNLNFLNNQFNIMESEQPKLHTTTRRSTDEDAAHSMDHIMMQTRKLANDADYMDDEALASSGLPDGNFTQGHATGKFTT